MKISNLNIEAGTSTPHIKFDSNSNKLLIEGRTHPEDALGFYKPILEWLDTYFHSIEESGQLTFKLQYFNTASAKIIVDILRKIKELKDKKGVNFKVDWHYDSYDEDMQHAASYLSDITGVDLNVVEED